MRGVFLGVGDGHLTWNKGRPGNDSRCIKRAAHLSWVRKPRPGPRAPTRDGRPQGCGFTEGGSRGPDNGLENQPPFLYFGAASATVALIPLDANRWGKSHMNDVNLNLFLKLHHHSRCQSDPGSTEVNADGSPVSKENPFAFTTSYGSCADQNRRWAWNHLPRHEHSM